jgi:hypothetical protein
MVLFKRRRKKGETMDTKGEVQEKPGEPGESGTVKTSITETNVWTDAGQDSFGVALAIVSEEE